MSRRLLALAAVAAMASASLVAVSSSPAHAVCINPDSSALYMYENRDGSGDVYQATITLASLHSVHYNDKASRLWNKYTCNAWVVYDDSNFGDRRYCIRPRQTVDLHREQWNFGDKISSIRKLGNGSCSGYPTFG